MIQPLNSIHPYYPPCCESLSIYPSKGYLKVAVGLLDRDSSLPERSPQPVCALPPGAQLPHPKVHLRRILHPCLQQRYDFMMASSSTHFLPVLWRLTNNHGEGSSPTRGFGLDDC